MFSIAAFVRPLLTRNMCLGVGQISFRSKGVVAFLFYCTWLQLPLSAQPGKHETYYRDTAPKKASQLWEEAFSQFKEENREKALKLVQEATSMEPGFVDAHLLLGDILASYYRDSLAVSAFRQAVALDPDYQPAAWLRLATLYTRMQQPGPAVTALDAYLLRTPAEGRTAERHEQARLERDRLARLQQAMEHPVPFDPKNLGDSVNSPDAEYLPSLSLDDSTLVFTRRLDGRNEDFFWSRKGNGGWSRAVNLGPPINTEWNEGAQHLSADGETLLFTMCNQADGLGSCDLYESRFDRRRGWSAARNLGPVINSAHWDSQPCLSADGNTLLFCSNRPGGQGERDLWQSSRLPDGNWSPPQNMGEGINTKGIDQAPFLHPDGSTVYFTSEGHGSLGGTDLYLCRMDVNGRWSAPENLGYPINTPDNEGSLAVSADGLSAYYASDRRDTRGQLDLYRFELPPSLRAKPVSYVKGKVRDALSGEPLAAAVELIDLGSGQIVHNLIADPKDGSFFLVLPAGDDYAFHVVRKGYVFYSAHFSLPAERLPEPYPLDIPLLPLKAGGEGILRNVFFSSGSATLDERSQREIERLADLLRDQPGLRIRLGGHTDDLGSDADNLLLSEARAKAVHDALLSAGITSERLEYRGYGETRPVDPGTSEVARARNRRTTFEILE